MIWLFPELKKVVNLRTGSINPSEYPNENFELYSIPAYDSGKSEIKSGVEIKSNKSVVQTGDVLFSKLNPRIPRVWVVGNSLGLRQISSTEFWALCCNQELIDRRFLLHLLLYPSFRERFADNTEAATKSRSRIKPFQLLDQKIPLPPISEQRRIVEILDQADALRKMRAEADAKAERILPALFIKMFGDPATNPMGWDVVLVERLFSKERPGTKCGPFGSALKKNEYVTDGIPVWGIDNVQPNNFVESGSLFITPSKYQELISYSVETGDILISRAGTVGRMCVARPQQSPSIINTNLIRLSLNKDEIFPEYFTSLFSYFPAAVSRLRATSDEGAYSFMNTKILKSLEIPLPPFELQKEYVIRMEQIKQMDLQKIESKDKLNNIFHVLLQRAFSGELTAKWREANMKELLLEMEEQAKALNLNKVESNYKQLTL